MVLLLMGSLVNAQQLNRSQRNNKATKNVFSPSLVKKDNITLQKATKSVNDYGRYAHAKNVLDKVSESSTISTKALWDVMFLYDYSSAASGTFSGFFWNGKVYTSQWSASNGLGKLWRWNISGNTLVADGTITIAGVTGSYNFEGFATDGTYIYAVNETNKIYKIDPTTWTATTITHSFSEPICIAYDEVTGGFWLGAIGGTTATLVSSIGANTGTTLTNGDASGIMGLAYDNVSTGGPWLISAVGSDTESNVSKLCRWNISSGVYEANFKNLASLPNSPSTGKSSGGIFTFSESGKWYVMGIDQGSTQAYCLELADVADPDAPAAVTNLTATADAMGALTATLDWTNPSLTISGNALSDLSINIYENNGIVPIYAIPSTTLIGMPATQGVTVLNAGTYTYKIIGENTAGEGIQNSVFVWIGPDVPAAPTNVTLVNNAMIAELTWTAPIIGLHNGYFTGANLKYDVYRLPDLVTPVAQDLSVLTFSEPISIIGNYTYKVIAKNDEGEGGNANSNTEAFCLDITSFPWIEEFNTSDIPPACWTMEALGDGLWEYATDGEENGAAFHDWYGENESWLITPKIHVPSTGVLLSFDSYMADSDYYEYSGVWISTGNNLTTSFIELHELSGNEIADGFLTDPIEISLAAYAGQDIYIAFVYNGEYAHTWAIDNVKLEELLANDIEVVAITAPISGNNLTNSEQVKVTLKNRGANTITTAEMKLIVDGGAAITETYTGSINSGATANYTFTATANLSAAGSHTIKVTAVLAGDGNATNDSKTITVTNTILSTLAYRWDFESGMPNNFTLIKVDQLTAHNTTIFPNNEPWAIYSNDSYALFESNMGTKCAASQSWTDPAGQINRWMITPRVKINSSDAKLYWASKAFEDGYEDGYNVKVSTTTNSVTNFTNSLFSIAADNTTWTLHSVDLSQFEGQSIYIGFQNNSNDMNLLFIDDIQLRGNITLDPEPITVVSKTPTGSGIAFNATVSVTFSGNVAPSGTIANVTIKDAQSVNVANVSATASGATITVAHANFEPNTSYTVNIPSASITNYNGSDITWNFTTELIGISDKTTESLRIYPNPSTGLVNIVVSEKSDINVYDVTGKLVDIFKVNANEIKSFSQSAGMYFVQITDIHGKVTTEKLIIE